MALSSCHLFGGARQFRPLFSHFIQEVQYENNTVHMHRNPQATIHLVVGTGGAPFWVNCIYPYPSWNEETFYKHGYSLVEAVNASYLSWKWVEAANDTVIDRMGIWQDEPTIPWVHFPEEGGEGRVNPIPISIVPPAECSEASPLPPPPPHSSLFSYYTKFLAHWGFGFAIGGGLLGGLVLGITGWACYRSSQMKSQTLSSLDAKGQYDALSVLSIHA